MLTNAEKSPDADLPTVTKLTEPSLEIYSKERERRGKAQLAVWDTELRGFGMIVGKTITFVAQARVKGTQERAKIGIAGRVNDKGYPWSVKLARIKAREELGRMAGGVSLNKEKREVAEAKAGAPTLRSALDAHLKRMAAKKRAERSISTLRTEMEKYMAAWLDRPISDLTGEVLVELHAQIKKQAKVRTGSNPANAKGAPLANRVIVNVGSCWNTLNRKLEGKLGNWNPAKAVDRDQLDPKRERVGDEDLPTWWATAQTLSPVRRDLAIFCMFSAMRSEAARNVRWADVDLDARSLFVPNPKGGESKKFSLPLGPTLVELLKRRAKENPVAFAAHGGDAGLVFPSLSRSAPFVVQPVAEAKERRVNKETGVREKYLSGPHVSRRTYLSVAAEAGVSELDRSVLANHAFGRQSVNQTYIEQAFPHLLECQSTIDAALRARMHAPKRRSRSSR